MISRTDTRPFSFHLDETFEKYLIALYRRKDLLLYLATSGLKAQYRNTALGYLWWLLDPLLGVLIYYFVIAVVFRQGGPDYGPFLVIGLIVWQWFDSSLSLACRSIASQAGIITQVYLPKAIFPLGAALSQLINFGFGLAIIALFGIFFQFRPGLPLVWLPYIILVQFVFVSALGLVLAYVSVFVRDAENVTSYVLRLWFFGSPVIWSEEVLAGRAGWIVEWNPMAYFLAAYRAVFMAQSPPDYGILALIGGLSTLLLVYMTYHFSQHEHKMIKVL